MRPQTATARGGDVLRLAADCVIVTASLGVLKAPPWEGGIRFIPPLPAGSDGVAQARGDGDGTNCRSEELLGCVLSEVMCLLVCPAGAVPRHMCGVDGPKPVSAYYNCYCCCCRPVLLLAACWRAPNRAAAGSQLRTLFLLCFLYLIKSPKSIPHSHSVPLFRRVHDIHLPPAR